MPDAIKFQIPKFGASETFSPTVNRSIEILQDQGLFPKKSTHKRILEQGDRELTYIYTVYSGLIVGRPNGGNNV